MRIRRGLEVSTANSAAAEAFSRGIDGVLAGRDGLEACMRAALDADPDFAMARFALGEKVDPAAPLTAWERSHLEASTPGSTAWQLRAIEHLERFPSDAWMYEKLHCNSFFFGSPRLRDRVANIATGAALRHPADPYFLVRHAGAVVERGGASSGLVLLERALRLVPDSLIAAHSRVHALHGLHRHDAVAHACEEVKGRAGRFRSHFAWHHALVLLGRGEIDRALRLYQGVCGPGANDGAAHLALADYTGFAWSFKLATGESPPQVAELARAFMESADLGDAPFVLLQRAALGGLAVGPASVGGAFTPLCNAIAGQRWELVVNEVARHAASLDAVGGSRLQQCVLALIHAWAVTNSEPGSLSGRHCLVPHAGAHPVLAAQQRVAA